MTKIRILFIAFIAFTAPYAFADSFGSSFGGSFLGSFGGSMMGNAISNRPRRCDRVYIEERPVVHHYVEAPTQTRVIHEVRTPVIEKTTVTDKKLSKIDKKHNLEVQTLKAELAETKARIKELEFENQQLKLKAKL